MLCSRTSISCLLKRKVDVCVIFLYMCIFFFKLFKTVSSISNQALLIPTNRKGSDGSPKWYIVGGISDGLMIYSSSPSKIYESSFSNPSFFPFMTWSMLKNFKLGLKACLPVQNFNNCRAYVSSTQKFILSWSILLLLKVWLFNCS